MEYRCRVGTTGGEVREAVFVADSEAHLRHELDEKGLHLLAVRPRIGLAGLLGAARQRRSIRMRDFLEFNQELATLLKAGMPLVQSLDLLRQGIADPLFKGLLDSVHDRVKAGAALSEAFEEHGALAPRIYTASLLAGERSGNLEPVLRRYVAYTRMLATVRRKTISALIYPLVLLGLSIVVVGVIVLKLVPAFSDFYASFNAELPLVTRLIVSVSTALSSQFLVVSVVAVGLGALAVSWVRAPGRRAGLDHTLLGIPGLGPVARKFATSQMARTLATLLSGGMPLVTALDVAARSIGNQYMARQLEIVAREVREGSSLAGAMRARGVFPDVALKMTEVGESTGALQDMLNSLADFYDEENETTLERFVAAVEPVLLIVMGLVIASLLLALYMPLFQLTSVAS